MNRHDAHILTHYTDISEAKQRDVRKLQAEVAGSFLKGLRIAFVRLIAGTPGQSGKPQDSSA